MTIKLIGRDSNLSKIQLNLIQKFLQKEFPDYTFEILTTKTVGDKVLDKPLFKMDEIGSFTKEIDEYLLEKKADIAVHSLKDVGLTRPGNILSNFVHFRENPRDILLYSPNMQDKVEKGEKVVVGTSSLRRIELAQKFLPKSFYRYNDSEIDFDYQTIRGNIETRIDKLIKGEFDAVFFSVAALNRLSSDINSDSENFVKKLRKLDWKLMPLDEYPCAPGQGALCLETLDDNPIAKKILNKIQDSKLIEEINHERQLLKKYGGGCHQKFGVSFIHFKDKKYLIAKGKSLENENIDILENLSKTFDLFKAKEFYVFDTRVLQEYVDKKPLKIDFDSLPKDALYFISHPSAIMQVEWKDFLKDKEVWVPGSSTLKKLTAKGYTIAGTCENFGIEQLNIARKGGFFEQKKVVILSHDQATYPDGFELLKTYTVTPKTKYFLESDDFIQIQKANFIFWSSYAMYSFFEQFISKPNAIYSSLSGKTSDIIRKKDPKRNLITFSSFKELEKWSVL